MANKKIKNYEPKFKNILLISIVCILVDIAAVCLRDDIYSNLTDLVKLLDKTIFSSHITVIVSVCTTIGSVTFSVFSFAKNSLSNNKMSIDNDYCKLLGIEVVYNPYVFVAIVIQCVALLFGWCTLFYSMAIYQVYSFKKCLTNYLKFIDSKKLSELIKEYESNLNSNEKIVLELFKKRLLLIYNDNSLWLDYKLDIFKKFDEYLGVFYNLDILNYKNSDDIIMEYHKKSQSFLKDLLGDEKNCEKNCKIIYTLLIIIAPCNVIKNSKDNYKFFNSDIKTEIGFYKYFSLYYTLLFYLIDNSPEMIKNLKFKKMMIENAEVCYAVIIYGLFKYINKIYITNGNKKMYKYCEELIKDTNSVFYDVASNRYEENVLYTYWCNWYNDCLKNKENSNVYKLSTQLDILHHNLLKLKKIQKSKNELEIL